MGWIMIALGMVGPPLVFLWPPGAILVFMAYRQRKPNCRSCNSRHMIPVYPKLERPVPKDAAAPTAQPAPRASASKAKEPTQTRPRPSTPPQRAVQSGKDNSTAYNSSAIVAALVTLVIVILLLVVVPWSTLRDLREREASEVANTKPQSASETQNLASLSQLSTLGGESHTPSNSESERSETPINDGATPKPSWPPELFSMRTWTSTDSQYKTTASFHRLKGLNVVLLKSNNSFTTVPMSKLSDRDLQFLLHCAGLDKAESPLVP